MQFLNQINCYKHVMKMYKHFHYMFLRLAYELFNQLLVSGVPKLI